MFVMATDVKSIVKSFWIYTFVLLDSILAASHTHCKKAQVNVQESSVKPQDALCLGTMPNLYSGNN